MKDSAYFAFRMCLGRYCYHCSVVYPEATWKAELLMADNLRRLESGCTVQRDSHSGKCVKTVLFHLVHRTELMPKNASRCSRVRILSFLIPHVSPRFLSCPIP